VKDCQLKFRLNMKELLLPLLTDDVVTKLEYEQLLANPGGPGWQEEHVEETLAERLGDCHERYIEILKEMEETMVLLCKATKVDDEQFQAILHTQNVSGPGSETLHLADSVVNHQREGEDLSQRLADMETDGRKHANRESQEQADAPLLCIASSQENCIRLHHSAARDTS
jgi:hypothetical protein